MSRTLRVTIDGTPLADEEARAFWQRFSDYMEEHRGDLGGFAQSEGLASVHPEMHAGAPVLVASRTSPQRAYANAPKRGATSGGGSTTNQRAGGGGGAGAPRGAHRPKKRGT